MNKIVYRLGIAGGRVVFFFTVRRYQVRPEIAERPGGYVLALTHLGHVDPFCSCIIVRRTIRWMARKEFFKFRITALALRLMGAFSVNRQGIPVSSVRRAIEHAKNGEIVGICPEGGRAIGPAAAIRGGKIKQGVCSIAIRSRVPVVPCVMLGTEDLNRVGPWLPAKRARIWVIYGEPLQPPEGKSNRAKRLARAAQLSEAYIQLHAELCEKFGLKDAPQT